MEPSETSNNSMSLEQECSAQPNYKIQECSKMNSHAVKCRESNWPHNTRMDSKWPHKANSLFVHLHLNAIFSLQCVAVLCVAMLLAPSATCLVIQSPNGNALNNYDIPDTNIANHGQPDVDHRPNHWQKQLDDYYLDSKDDQSPFDNEKGDDEMANEAGPSVAQKNVTNVCFTNECIAVSGVLSSTIDTLVDPCDDFYSFVCGRYIKDHAISSEFPTWSHFQKVYYEIRGDLNKILNSKEKFEKVIRNITVLNKLYDFYNSCMDLEQRDYTGYTSLLRLISELGGWPMIDYNWDPNAFNWEKAYVKLAQQELYFLIKIEPITDLLNTSKTILKIGPPYRTRENIINLGGFQARRSEPEFLYTFEGRRVADVAPETKQDAQTSEDTETEKLKNKYKEVIFIIKDSITNDSHQLNVTEYFLYLEGKLQAIYDLQDALQDAAMPMAPLESYQANYTQLYVKNISELQALVQFDITDLVKQMYNVTLPENQQFFVPDPHYLQALDEVLRNNSKSVLADYFATNVVMTLGGLTTTKMISLLITNVIQNKTNEGEIQDELQNLCFEHTLTYLPELMGKFYLETRKDSVEKWRKDANEIVRHLNDSFHEQLSKNGWMDASTIKGAIAKLDAMSVNIGFPEWYLNDTQFVEYCAIYTEISQEDFFNSAVSASTASQLLSIQDLNDRLHFSALTSWPKHRQIIDVNAFYFFASNGIYIPASLAQSPFWSNSLPMAYIFGSLGMIIGHEMTHAFDNTGRLYDFQGDLRDWWSPKTAQSFKHKTECFVQQYSNYTIKEFKNNGERTLSENIADNGGLREAYRAFKKYQKTASGDSYNYLPGAMANFTEDQLFFMSFTNMWCSKLKTDPGILESQFHYNAHSPPNIRVIGSLANFANFSEAFHCSVGRKMNPENKCELW